MSLALTPPPSHFARKIPRTGYSFLHKFSEYGKGVDYDSKGLEKQVLQTDYIRLLDYCSMGDAGVSLMAVGVESVGVVNGVESVEVAAGESIFPEGEVALVVETSKAACVSPLLASPPS